MLSKALKAITALLVVVLLIILLSSCVTAQGKGNGYARMMLIERYDDVCIYADTKTGVEYLVHSYKDYYGMAPVLNADGTPVLAPNFDAKEDISNGT